MSIQEHFNFVDPETVFKSGFKDFSCFVIPGHRTQNVGRAKAGLAQLCRNNYDGKKLVPPHAKICMERSVAVGGANKIFITSGFRIQAQVLELPTTRVLWLNTYFPTDPKKQKYDDGEL